MQQQLSGVWTALVSPFTETGELDLAAFDALLQRQIDACVTGVVIGGTTGESPTLQPNERLALIKRAKAYCNEKIRIMAGSGCNNTQQSIEMSRLCVEAGADALLVVTPPYNRPPIEGLKKHYTLIAEAIVHSHVPIVLYHVPGRTAQSISCEDLGAICASHPAIAAVKEASGNPILFSRYIHASKVYPAPPIWLSGDDHGFLPTLSVGGEGIISVIAGVFPDALVALYRSFQNNNTDKALKIHNALFGLMDALFSEVNPIPVKALLAHIGLISPYLRSPLHIASENTMSLLIDTYEQAQEALAEIDLETKSEEGAL